MKDKVIEILEKYVSDGYRNEKGIYECDIDDVADEVVKLFAIHNVVGSCRCSRCRDKHHDCLNGKMCYVCDNVTQGN